MTKQAHHFAPLDGLRGLAILAVIAAHAYRQDGRGLAGRAVLAVAQAGWAGVTLFFVLSGFLITGILLDTRHRPGWYRDFLARRTLRIFPLYYGFLAAYWFVLPRWPAAAARLAVPTGPDARCYWLYLTNMRERITGSAGLVAGLDHLWSLAVEEQVYLAWPLLIGLASWRALPRLLVGLLAASVAWKVAAALLRQGIAVRYEWMPACLDAFAAGGLVAWASRDPAWSRRLGRLARAGAYGLGMLLAGLVAGNGFHFNFWRNPAPMLTVGSTAAAAFFACLIGVCLTAPDRGRLNGALSAPWLRWLGRYSYAAYLFHMAIVELLGPAGGGPPGPIRRLGPGVPGAVAVVALVAALSFAAAWASWHLWERHFLALKRFFPSSGRVVRPPAVG